MKKMLVFLAASLAILPAHARPTPMLQCVGTEPFWDIKTDGKGFLSMGQADSQRKFYAKTQVQTARGVSDEHAFQIKAQDRAQKILRLNVLKNSSACSDGMSDQTYSYSAMVEVGNVIYTGCCR